MNHERISQRARFTGRRVLGAFFVLLACDLSGCGHGDDDDVPGNGVHPGPAPTSCADLDATCGDRNCCLSLEIPGGSFDRACDGGDCLMCSAVAARFPAKISHFALDAFEITVARFRAFVESYPDSKPAAGTGNNPENDADSGWDTAWDAALPESKSDFTAALEDPDACPDGIATWTSEPGDNERLPMNCVTWYEAQAFCIWDGGRLPTEAEWNYAAAGGGQARTYPWSEPARPATIDSTQSIYLADDAVEAGAPAAVGSVPAGRGRWGQDDLSGNVSEWVWDDFNQCYEPVVECSDCGANTGYGKIGRGGSYRSYSDRVKSSTRDSIDGPRRSTDYGLRCARALPTSGATHP